ncbi:BLUF domain-containing protein [Pseudovibrio exalbescens]|uniref:BLUF domain-containing protein n=1 Tax=Pseudovibrio exalbescens TaxID=197461 RepID=A0A1U7JEI1_9HYPH|nr:BLUF domain-containing protein [Pseudovibrio exalbescens]OKL43127.1 hypothetical protein A3843_15535 [Pseudovibrio exalbescens]
MAVSQLCYRSRIHWPALKHDLEAEMDLTLTRIRRINSRVGVTGALILTDTHIFQLLEGPWTAVKHTFECVLQDRRHSHLTVVHNSAHDHQLFCGAWMQFFDLRKDEIRPSQLTHHLAGAEERLHRDEIMDLFYLLSLTLSEGRITQRVSLM